jgi:hypothetical protein
LEGDLWSLFFTPEMMRLVTKATNEKIEADFIAKDYSEETLKRSPHIAQTDEVTFRHSPTEFHNQANLLMYYSKPDNSKKLCPLNRHLKN